MWTEPDGTSGPYLRHHAVHIRIYQDHRIQGVTPVMESSLA